jgi:hypothetical protein
MDQLGAKKLTAVFLVAASAFLSRPAFSQYDPFHIECTRTCRQEMQVIGWSADESFYAIRLYSFLTDDHYLMEGGYLLPKDCEGYVTHQGKQFNGGLSIHIYHDYRIWENHPIQVIDSCTPLNVARERLRRAKVALKKYGIQLKNPGKVLTFTNNEVTVYTEAAGSFTLKYELSVVANPDSRYADTYIHTGFHRLYMVTSDTSQVVLEKSISAEIGTTSGYGVDRGIYAAFLSPSQKTILVYCFTHEASWSLDSRCPCLFGVLRWEDGQWKTINH